MHNQPTTKKPPLTQPKKQKHNYPYHQHQIPRKRLLMALQEGEPCWWCGRPMHRKPGQNFDKLPLAADHIKANGAKNGEKPDRLLHYTCNSQRQNGKNDHIRPAIAGFETMWKQKNFNWA